MSRTAGTGGSGPHRRKWARIACGVAAAGLVAVGAAFAIRQAAGRDPSAAAAPWGAGPAAVSPEVPPEPEWLVEAPEAIQGLYRWAIANRDILQYIPCYCGCGDRQHGFHKSNADCYGQVRAGRFAYDVHATGCGVCLNITARTIQMRAEGRTVAEIRRAIDDEYGSLGVEPTPTPQPPDVGL